MELSTHLDLMNMRQLESSKVNQNNAKDSRSESRFWSDGRRWVCGRSGDSWKSSLRNTKELRTISLPETAIISVMMLVSDSPEILYRVGLIVSPESVTSIHQFYLYRFNDTHSWHFIGVVFTGLFCDCIIPASVRSCKVGIEDNQSYNGDEMKKKLRSRSGRSTSSSRSRSSEKSTSLASIPVDLTRSFGTRSILPPSSLFLLDSPSSSP